MTTRLDEAKKRIASIQAEIEALMDEKQQVAEELTGSEVAQERTIDVLHAVEDNESIEVTTDADEVVLIVGEGCLITLNGDVGIVRVKAGDGTSIIFDGKVGGANVSQSNGSDCQVLQGVDSLTIDQGPGSTLINL